MSVEKLVDHYRLEKEELPHTQILNTLINDIKDNDAYRMYCLLQSKTKDWKVNKEWTRKKCLVAETKSKKCWGYLERCGLIEYISRRSESGQFIGHTMRVLNGTRFNKDEPFENQKTKNKSKNKSTGDEIAPVDEIDNSHWCNNPPSGKTTRVVSARLLNKDCTKQTTNKNKERYKATVNLYKPYPDDFFPDEKNRELLTMTARRVNMSEHELLQEFERVHRCEYKTKTDDWQKKCSEFLNIQKPKRTYEDSTGRKRRYDDQPLYS